MMLPEFARERFYVNALTGWSIVFPIGGASGKPAPTEYSVHDSFFGGKLVARFPGGMRTVSGRYATREERECLAVELAHRLNAEEAAA